VFRHGDTFIFASKFNGVVPQSSGNTFAAVWVVYTNVMYLTSVFVPTYCSNKVANSRANSL
jgi:hypothetical protein